MNTTLSRRRLAALCALSAVSVAGVLIAAAPASRAAATGRGPIVHVDGGPVRGVVNGGVTSFLGIPYAAPPTGELRWQPPQPVVAWHGIRDASPFGPSCPQSEVGNPFLPPGPISEDCLDLNV